MTIFDKIRDGKLQYEIIRAAAKISELSSGKINNYEYLKGEKILPTQYHRLLEDAKLSYSPVGKAFEKQVKRAGKKQAEAIPSLDLLTETVELLFQ